MNFIFIRHSESVGNAFNKAEIDVNSRGVLPESIMGHLNWELSQNGIEKAKDIGKTIDIKPQKVFVSPLIRTMQTAKAIFGESIECLPDKRIIEQDIHYFDDFANFISTKDRNQKSRKYITEYVVVPKYFYTAKYGCETTAHVAERLKSFINEKAKENLNECVCVSHCLTMCCLHLILYGAVLRPIGNLEILKFTDKEFNDGLKRLQENKNLKLIVFSDIHHGTKDIGTNLEGVKRKLCEQAVDLTKQLLSIINKIAPDVVVNLGDSIEDTKNHNYDILRLKEIMQVMEGSNSPIYHLAGNHELRTMTRDKFAEIAGYKNPTFSMDIKGYHFVFLCNSMKVKKDPKELGFATEISQADLDWLRNDLADNKLPSLIFLHYGLAEDDMKGNWWFEKNPQHALLSNRHEVKMILKTDKNLLAVFSGHQHWTKQITENGIKYFVVGSLTEDMNLTGVADKVYYEIDINGREIKVMEKRLCSPRKERSAASNYSPFLL